MSRAPRNWPAERAAIQAAADRLLAGTPLWSRTGNLSATQLIVEYGLTRWKVYEHRDLVEHFHARVKATDAVQQAMRDLVAENQRLAPTSPKPPPSWPRSGRARRCCGVR